MAFNRQNPSPRYRQLVDLYSNMHRDDPDIFAGRSLREHLPTIRNLIRVTGAKSLLDYGSGKGLLYAQRDIAVEGIGTIPSVRQFLGVSEVRLYDPCVKAHSTFPTGKRFDGVISTDTLEHIPTSDLPWVVEELFSLASRFVFGVVASFPAIKNLPTGENAHESQESYRWWKRTIREIAFRHPWIVYRFEIERDLHHMRLLPYRRIVRVVSGGLAVATLNKPASTGYDGTDPY